VLATVTLGQAKQNGVEKLSKIVKECRNLFQQACSI